MDYTAAAQQITQQVIRRAKRGDKQAISMIYQTYVDSIYRYIVQRVESDMVAEDLTSDVFIRMVRDLPKYKLTGAPFESWLYRIASARVIDHRRQQTRRTTTNIDDHPVASETDLEGTVVTNQEFADLKSALALLSEQDQLVLTLRFVERKSHRDVAQLLGKSLSAVHSIQHRALAKLAQMLKLEE